MRAMAVMLVLLGLGRAACAAEDAGEPKFDPIDRYHEQQLEGWRILVHDQLRTPQHESLREQTLKLLGGHLYQISRTIPEPALTKLREVPIWVEYAHPKHKCMCYHPDAGWLRAHDMNPEKAKAVELANAENFLKWTHDQPWMVFHELAHAYHDRELGFDHAEVRACYQQAMAAKLYDRVLRINGRDDRHYAATNEKEYFAEASEAFFGTNDFYPFVRAELRRHDPAMFETLGRLWRVQRPAEPR